MARRDRSSVTNRGSATPYSVARYAAPSRYVDPYVPRSHRAVLPPVSATRRVDSRVRAARQRQRPLRPLSFGTWYLPPEFLSSEAPRALACARRGIRKSVLFAKRLTGVGSYARKKHFSNRSCK